MTQEQLSLFEQHAHLAETTVYKLYKKPRYVAKKYGLDAEDLFQEANCALWEATFKFKKEGGRSFQNFAITKIRWALINKLNREYKPLNFRHAKISKEDIAKLKFISLDDKPSSENEEHSTYHDIFGDDYNYHIEGEVIGKALEAIIPPRTLEFIKLKIQGVKVKDIAEQFGVSREMVRVDIKNTGKRLKGVCLLG